MAVNYNLYSKWYDKAHHYDIFEKIFRLFNSMIVKDMHNLKPETINNKSYGLPKKYYDLLRANSPGVCTYNEVKFFCDAMRKVDMDNHILISGQNGTGKSLTAITLAMYLDPTFTIEKNMIFSFHSTGDLIDKLSKMKDSVIVIDEANVFMHHKQHMDRKQIALINAIEITRANRNIVISCVRDPRRVSYAYRNGKVHTIIHFTDRSQLTGAPVGFTLQGMWFFEQEDKFMLHLLTDITDYRELEKRVEQLPTFRGYMNASTLTDEHKEQIGIYKVYKDKQMLTAIELWKENASKKDLKKVGNDLKQAMLDIGA